MADPPLPPGTPPASEDPALASEDPASAIEDSAPVSKDSTPAGEDSAPASSEQPQCSPAQSDPTAIATMKNSTQQQEPEPCVGSAMFSTEMGTRAPRKLTPPFPPVIVRSDRIEGVVAFAHVWLKRYPRQYLCIFSNCGWTIHDLWDPADIHLESPTFCQETLGFIERDNYYRAKEYAVQWSQAHSERLSFIGGDMAGFYDPEAPLTIVDKLFSNGEVDSYPRTFLWRVAHIMRASTVEATRTKLVANYAGMIQQEPAMGAHGPIVAKNPMPTVEMTPTRSKMADGQRELKDPYAFANLPANNRAPSLSGEPLIHMSAIHTGLPRHPGPHMLHRKLSYGPLRQSDYQNEMIGPMRMGIPGPRTMVPNTGQQVLNPPKGRSRRKGPDNYNRSIQPAGWVENVYCGASGSMHRHYSGSSTTMPSPHLNATPIAAGHHMMPHFAPGHPMTSPSIPVGQSVHSVMMQQGRMPPQSMSPHPLSPHLLSPYPMPSQSMPMPEPPMIHPCFQHPSDIYGPPIADVTNTSYSVDMPISNIERRGSGVRNNQHHGIGGALFDPYDGARSSFNSPATLHSGKKHNQTGFPNQSSRSRKHSGPSNRPEPGQQGLDRPGNNFYNGSRGYASKPSTEDNPAITEDPEMGCHTCWIVTKNETVKEVFIGDLPEDIHATEIDALFQLRIGTTPISVCIRPLNHFPTKYSTRKHAFVGLTSVSEAKEAISIRDPKLRDMPISITVPKRFYQRPCASPPADGIDTTFRSGHAHNGCAEYQAAHSSTNVPPHGSKSIVSSTMLAATDTPIYSPQDARSGLQKKSEHLRKSVSSSGGSPRGRNSGSKKHQESPAKASKDKETTKDTVTDKVDETTPVKHEVPTGEPHALGSEAGAHQPEQVLGFSEPLQIADHCPKQPPVLKIETAQDADITAVDSSGAADDEAMQPVGDKREGAGTTLFPELSNAVPPMLTIGPISTEQIASEQGSVPDASNGMLELSAASGRATSPKGSKSEDELKSSINISSTQEFQPACPTKNPDPVTQVHEMAVHDGEPPSIFTQDGVPNQNVVDNSMKTETASTTHGDNHDLTVQAVLQHIIAPDPNLKKPDRHEPAPSVAAAMKDSIKQIQSLSPFARPNKSQLKKEREQKKKALRKEKAEQAEKLKETKMATSSKANGGSATKSKTGRSLPDNSSDRRENGLAGAAACSGKEVNSGTVKERPQPVPNERVGVKPEAGHHGKHNGANDSSILNEIDSETHKTSANFNRTTDTSEHVSSPLVSSSLSLQASASGSPNDIELENKAKSLPPTDVSLGSEVNVVQAGISSPTGETRVSNLPSLSLIFDQSRPSTPLSESKVQELRDCSPSKEPGPAALASSEITSNDDELCSTRGVTEEPLHQRLRDSSDNKITDHANVSTRTLPRALPIPLQVDDSMSDIYSPAIDEFHTPLQTPSALMAAYEQAPGEKKRKKKSSKASKNNARRRKLAKLQQVNLTTDSATVSTDNDHILDDEPFSAQMMHIDAVRDGTIDSSLDSKHEYAYDVIKEYGQELGWDLEEVAKIPKPSGEDVDNEAIRRYDAAQIRVAEIWMRESHPHENSNDLYGYWSKDDMSKRGAI